MASGVVFLEKKVIVIGALVLAASFIIGILIGYYGRGNGSPEPHDDPMFSALIQVNNTTSLSIS